MERITERYSDGRKVFLRLSDQEESFADSLYEIKMICANHPEGLLEMHVFKEDGGLYYDYDVTGLRSLKDSEGDEVQVDYLYSLIRALAREADVMAEYLLNPDKLFLSPETVFFSPEAGEVYFCYDPGKTTPLRESMQRLMEYFLKKLDPKDEEDILFMYGLYQRTREPMVTLSCLNEYFEDNKEKYLKIGEEREQRKQNRQEKTIDTRAEEILEENSLFDELGIEKTEKNTVFSFLKKNREIQTVSPVNDIEYEEPEAREAFEKAGTERLVPEPASTRRTLNPQEVLGRIRPYGFELAVCGVVLAGVVLFMTV